METIEYRTLDKSDWGPGPWASEPDKRQWLDAATGYPCLIRRAPKTGALCGYVGVPESHPLFSVDYGDPRVVDILVHGGVTFADSCDDDEDEGIGICHRPGSDESDVVWWLGFDCAHGGDLLPACRPHGWFVSRSPGSTYRDFEYVTHEVERLAAQLLALAGPRQETAQ